MVRAKEKGAAIVIITTLATLYFAVGVPSFIEKGSILSALTHHFFHANILHLVVNCYATWVLIARRWFKPLQIVSAYIVASLSFLCCMDIPAVGFSNFLYAFMGMNTPPLWHKWWYSQSTIIFIIITLGYLLIPGVSAITHIVSFVGGVIINAICNAESQSKKDYGKTKRR